jgi:hypothetical protein
MNMFKLSAMLTTVTILIICCSAQVSMADALDDHMADLGAHGQPWYDIAEAGGDWSDALTALSSGGTLLISEATTISESITVPANVHIKWLPGCIVTVNSTYTLTITSPIKAGNYQLFANGSDVVIESAFDNKVPVTWFGGTDFQAFQQAHSATIDEAIFIHFPKGVYDFNGSSFKTATACSPIYISGEGMDNSTITDMYVMYGTGIIEINNIAFDDCTNAIITSNNITKIDIDNVKFQDCLVGIKAIQDSNDFLDNVQITNCEFSATSTLAESIINISFRAGGISNAIIKNNIFKDLLTASGAVVCIETGDASAAAGANHDILINNNLISNIGNTTRSTVSHGILGIGDRIHITDNIVKDCYWTNALYMKSNSSVMANNSVKDVESGGITFKSITAPNTPINNTITGNSVVGVCDNKAGLRVIGIASVTGNVVEIEMDENGNSEGGFSFECKTSAVIRGNLNVTGNVFKGPRGVFITSTGNTIFSKNLVVSEAYGLYVGFITGGTYENLTITGNTFNVEEYGVKCLASHANTVFKDNVINLTSVGATSASYFSTDKSLTVSNNVFNIISGSGASTNYVFGYAINENDCVVKIDENIINTSLPLSTYALNCDGGTGASVFVSNNIIRNQSGSAFTGTVFLRETPALLSICNNTFEGEQGRVVALEPGGGISQDWENIIVNNNRVFGFSDLIYGNSSATIDTLSVRDNLFYDDTYTIIGSQTIGAQTIANNIELVP